MTTRHGASSTAQLPKAFCAVAGQSAFCPAARQSRPHNATSRPELHLRSRATDSRSTWSPFGTGLARERPHLSRRSAVTFPHRSPHSRRLRLRRATQARTRSIKQDFGSLVLGSHGSEAPKQLILTDTWQALLICGGAIDCRSNLDFRTQFDYRAARKIHEIRQRACIAMHLCEQLFAPGSHALSDSRHHTLLGKKVAGR